MPTNEPIRILQIGDIHYPDARTGRPTVDLKRDPFDVSDEVAPEGLRIQKITQTFSQYALRYFDAVAFMGDFTTGNLDASAQMQSMDDCLAYLDRTVTRPLLGKHSRSNSLFVPGNHDVDRTKCPSKPKNRMEKFSHYTEWLTNSGYTKNSTTGISSIEIAKEGGISVLHGINTCLGCGEFMTFPERIKNDLIKQLADILQPGTAPTAKEVVSRFLDLTERLDAPLIDAAVLNNLDVELNRQMHERPSAVQVVVGHHNLLPQTTPRVAPFSELMNSGELRSFLSTKEAPVIYLHGHIHQDPVEIVFSQSNPTSCVISISAPEFVDGYNVIEIHFDDDGTPLGVIIQPIRQDEVGRISKPEPRRIPFRQGPHRIAAITGVARQIFYTTFSRNAQRHFHDLLTEYPNETGQTIERAILELEWLGLVQIANRSRPAKQWNVSSAV